MIEITTELIEEELTYEGLRMLGVSIGYPSVSGVPKKAERRINSFYSHNAKTLLRRFKKKLLPAAIEDYTFSLEKSVPFKPFEAELSFTVTHNGGGILSLYRDVLVRFGGARRIHERTGDTWNAETGWFAGLKPFFPQGANYRKLLLTNATETARQQEKLGTHRYYDSYRKLIKSKFSPHDFYITGSGISIFFDEGVIAPYSEGIPIFNFEKVLPEC